MPTIATTHADATAICEIIAEQLAVHGETGYVLLRDIERFVQSHPAYVATKKEAAVAPQVAPMSDGEAVAFERTVIPFGAHKGGLVGNVPLEYLAHLVDPSSFIQEVRRYLRNPKVKLLLNEED